MTGNTEVNHPRRANRISFCGVVRKNFVRLENTDTNRSYRPSVEVPHKELKVVIDQEPAKIIRLQPMVKMHLVKVGSNDFLSQLMRFTA
jgi:hypothetical protein